jgi:hypothetical protein
VASGCGGSSGGAPTVTTSSAAALGSFVLPPAESLGWLALVPMAAPLTTTVSGVAAEQWLPIDDSTALLPMDAQAELPQGEVMVVAASGPPAKLQVSEKHTVPYGCDSNALEALALRGETALAPGPAWILPPSAPASWQPRGLEIETVALDAHHRSWKVGALLVDLTATDAEHARWTMAMRSPQGVTTWLTDQILERPKMAGADASPMDLTAITPGMPALVAAYQVVANSAMLLVVATPGYEGMQLGTWLFDSAGVREVAGMHHYLYSCAF